MEIDRIELADCGSPEKIVAEILRQQPDIPVPIPIEDLAKAVGITVIHRLETASFEGGLVTQPERVDGVILVNGNGSRQRQRFTIGHELGHYLIIAHQPVRPGQFTCSTEDMAIRTADRDDRAKRMEMEANRFSAAMLMPLARFRPEMRNLGKPDLDHVIALADRYDMSKEATAVHYALHHDTPCAILFSKNGVIRRSYKPTRFPFIESRIGSPLPSNSLSAGAANGDRVGWQEVDRGVWLAQITGKCGSVQEQVVRLANGWAMTLLVGSQDDDEEEEDEGGIRDAFEVWENPRFPGKSRKR